MLLCIERGMSGESVAFQAHGVPEFLRGRGWHGVRQEPRTQLCRVPGGGDQLHPPDFLRQRAAWLASWRRLTNRLAVEST